MVFRDSEFALMYSGMLPLVSALITVESLFMTQSLSQSPMAPKQHRKSEETLHSQKDKQWSTRHTRACTSWGSWAHWRLDTLITVVSSSSLQLWPGPSSLQVISSTYCNWNDDYMWFRGCHLWMHLPGCTLFLSPWHRVLMPADWKLLSLPLNYNSHMVS